jgi:parallel beta-helix repeat protein
MNAKAAWLPAPVSDLPGLTQFLAVILLGLLASADSSRSQDESPGAPAPNPSGRAGAALYVDGGSAAGSDSPGNGSEAKPWRTIGYGISRLGAGDTLYVKAGTYNETLDITGPAGSAGAPTVIRAYPGQAVTIRGDGVNTGRLRINRTRHLTLEGFGVTNFNQGIFVEGSDHILLRNCAVYGVGQEGISIHSNSSYVTVEGCTVHDTGTWKYNGEGIYVGRGDSAPVDVDNTNNVTLLRNTIYNTTDEAIELKIGTHDITVDGNTIHHANTALNGFGGAAIEVNQSVGSVQHWNRNPNQVVRNNVVHDVGPGKGATLYNSGIRAGTGGAYYNNLVYDINPLGDGILVDNESGDSYTRCLYHNTIDVPSARAVAGSAAADIRNNIGPAAANNIPTSGIYFVDRAGADYHLVPRSAPINAGLDLTATVPTDIEGVSRSANPPPDLGAYEYAPAGRPAPPVPAPPPPGA